MVLITACYKIADVIYFENYKEFLKYCYNSQSASGKLEDILVKVKEQPKTKPFDYNYNTQEGKIICWHCHAIHQVQLLMFVPHFIVSSICYFQGTVLFNLHTCNLIDEISNLLNELNKKSMHLEILSAVLAEEIVGNGTKINLDPEEIEWPDVTILKAPVNEKKAGLVGIKKSNK